MAAMGTSLNFVGLLINELLEICHGCASTAKSFEVLNIQITQAIKQVSKPC
jgi:hypothetical protein